MLLRVSVNEKLLQLPLTQGIAKGRVWLLGEIFVEAVDVGVIVVVAVAELVTDATGWKADTVGGTDVGVVVFVVLSLLEELFSFTEDVNR
jgi:hypothetical protein